MIKDHLVPLLKERFPDLPFSFRNPPEPIAALPNPNTEIGELQVCDDYDEATIYFAGTHGHFGCWNDSLSKEENERRIAEDILDFMEAVFRDEVVFTSAGLFGGWSRIKPGRRPRRSSWFAKRVVWSGIVK